jgi:membrane fusion protein, multidrug efflux system
MDSLPPDLTPPDPDAEPPRRRIGRRAMLIGSVIAILVVAGIGWLAWDLTHRAPAAGAAGTPGAGRAAGAGGPGGGGAGGRSPATTVGVAAAERADIPVTIEALGTVVPLARCTFGPRFRACCSS